MIESAPTATRAAGFTLLEMTVVLALMALIALTTIEALRFGRRAYIRVVTADEAAWMSFAAQRFLRGILEAAQPFKAERADGNAYGLEGTTTHLSVSASKSRTRGPGMLLRYEIFVAPDPAEAGRRSLVVRESVDRDGGGASNPHTEVLVENVLRIEWSYFDTPCHTPGEWRGEWHQRHQLPSLVRLRVAFPPDDRRQWPDLITAPRVTDDFIFSLHSDGEDQRRCGGTG